MRRDCTTVRETRRLGVALLLGALAFGRAETVVFSVQLTNVGDAPLEEIHLRVPVPVDTEYQRIDRIGLAPEPIRSEQIPAGGRVAFLRFRDLQVGHSAWAFVAARLEPLAFEARRGLLRRRLSDEVRERCLGSSCKLDPNSAEVRERAAAVAAGERDAHALVQAFVVHICEAFEYELDDCQDDVETVIRAGRGSCSELSRVLVALCRARGVPARFASGTRLRDRDVDVYVDTVHHRWVEVFLPRHGWFPVDVSMAVSRSDPGRRFGVIPARRLALLRTAGIEDHALFSSGLTLVEPEAPIARTLRSYWFAADRVTVERGLRVARRQRRSGWPGREARAGLLALSGIHAIPFLAMGLHEPMARGHSAEFAEALAALEARAAAAPLIDLAGGASHVPQRLADLLEETTGQRFESGAQWAAWMRSGGLAFFRGEDLPEPR